MRLIQIFAAMLMLMIAVHNPGSAEVYVGAKKNQDEQNAPSSTIKPLPTPDYSDNQQTDAQAAEERPITQGMNDFVNRYYSSCMAREHPILKGESLEYLCTCSAARIANTMTEEDAHTMLTDTPEGVVQRNHLLLNVYVPCMKSPVQALLYQGCMNDANIKSHVKSPDPLCGCMSLSMSNHIQAKAPAYILETLRTNPTTDDPMATYLASPDYMEAAQKTLLACIDKFQ